MIVNTLSHGVVELQQQKQASKVECGRESTRDAPCPEKGVVKVKTYLTIFTVLVRSPPSHRKEWWHILLNSQQRNQLLTQEEANAKPQGQRICNTGRQQEIP